MVSNKTDKHKTIKKVWPKKPVKLVEPPALTTESIEPIGRSRLSPLHIALILAGIMILTFGAVVGSNIIIKIRRDKENSSSQSTLDELEEPEKPKEPEESEEPEKPVIKSIDFQSTVNTWVNSVGGEKGVAIYDLDLNTLVGQYHADEKFNMASIYKLFVVYEGYRRIEDGEFEAGEVINNRGDTLLKCLDLAIRESDSTCAERIWNMIGHGTLDKIVQTEYGLPDVSVGSISATPNEIVTIMKRFYLHPGFNNETLLAKMQDSFLNQPSTQYDWRQGLPSGFSDQVLVYNKVGWAWDFDNDRWSVYDDAAILDFTPYDRHFIVVVMTKYLRYQDIQNFGKMIENAFNEQINTPSE